MNREGKMGRILSLALLCALSLEFGLPLRVQTSALPPSQESVAITQQTQPSLPTLPAADGVSLEVTPAASFVDPQNGLSVDDLIRIAGERNRELLAARQNIMIGRGRIVQAGLRPNPSINFDSTTDRSFSAEGEGGYSISYQHPIELGGKRGKRLDVARLELDRAQSEVAFRERQIQADIKSQYAVALAAIETLRSAEQLLELNRNMLQVTQVRLAKGDAARLDTNLVRVEVNRLQAQQLQFANRARTAILSLQMLIGTESDHTDQSLKLRGELQAPSLDLTLDAAQQRASEQRDDLKAARLSEQAAEAELRLEKAQGVPDITPFAGYQKETSAFGFDSLGKAIASSALVPGSKLLDRDRLLNFGVSVQLPFFNRNQGAIQQAAAALEQARRTREFAELVVKRDVAAALNHYQSARAAVQLFQTEILPRGRENLQIIRDAYSLGDQSILEVIAEQRRLIESQNEYVEALKEHYLSFVELERAVGGPLQ